MPLSFREALPVIIALLSGLLFVFAVVYFGFIGVVIDALLVVIMLIVFRSRRSRSDDNT
jgi:hypothetical protein